MGSLRVIYDWASSLSLFTFMHWRREWQPTPVFLPGESQGQGSLVGCHRWGHTESDTTKWLSSSSIAVLSLYLLSTLLAKKSVSVQLKEFSETEHPSTQIGTQNFTPLLPLIQKPLFCSFWVISVRVMLLVTSKSILHFSLFCTRYKWNLTVYTTLRLPFITPCYVYKM